jgi:phosphopantetheinyl transferase (holo-ACP synthase)
MTHGITSSHALRNPSRRVQLSRVRRVGASGASKATQTLLTAKAKKRKIDLNNEVDDFFAERNKKITELAARYCKKESDIRALLCNTSQLKAHRRPNLRNGVLHQRALDLRERGASRFLLSPGTP